MVNMIGFHHKEPTYNTSRIGDPEWFMVIRHTPGFTKCITPCARAKFTVDNPATLYTEHPGDIGLIAQAIVSGLPSGRYTSEQITAVIQPENTLF